MARVTVWSYKTIEKKKKSLLELGEFWLEIFAPLITRPRLKCGLSGKVHFSGLADLFLDALN
jgi:hypothetical protein